MAVVGLLVSVPCPLMAQPVVATFERFHAGERDEAVRAEGGLLLLNELNCVACHAAPVGWVDRLPGRGKISLTGVTARVERDFLERFIRDPHQAKPGTLMPQVAGGSGLEESRALMAFLSSLAPTATRRTYPAGDWGRGQRLFNSIGCVSCHSPSVGETTYASVPLGLAPHYDRSALAAFIQDPLHLRPSGRMPATHVSDREAADLAEFLGAKNLSVDTPTVASASEIAVGRSQFQARNCVACHTTGQGDVPMGAAALASLRVDRGCLAPTAGSSLPRFNLSEDQTTAIIAALRFLRAEPHPIPLTVDLKLDAKFKQLNCYACHEWRGRGGIEAARSAQFAASGGAESLGELGLLPPSLDQSGRKLTRDWLEKLLIGGGGGVRPYLSVRMPRVGPEASGDLVGWLMDACRPQTPLEIDTSGGKGHQRSATGRMLLGTATGGLGCISCHGIKDREPNGIRAINLTDTAKRLQPEYFKALLLDPQALQPGTIMPPLFIGRPDANKEIESIWTYFKELDQSPRLPEGLELPEAFELKPSEEERPIVFRTFLEGAGVQAVTVGHPSGANMAFDTFEVRWALVWRGRFLDAKSNWEERAMKPVKPLGENARMVPNHMPFAQLSDAADPWPTAFGREAGYRYKGYRLDHDGNPTFRYAIGDLQVEDVLWPSADGRALRRRVTIKGHSAGWFFRGLATEAQPQPLKWQSGTATFEELIPL